MALNQIITRHSLVDSNLSTYTYASSIAAAAAAVRVYIKHSKFKTFRSLFTIIYYHLFFIFFFYYAMLVCIEYIFLIFMAYKSTMCICVCGEVYIDVDVISMNLSRRA